MRVVYTLVTMRKRFGYVGYTFQMRVAYTSLYGRDCLTTVGYTFQMRVAYTGFAAIVGSI